MTTRHDSSPQLSQVVVPLLKGVLYRGQSETGWQALLGLQSQVRDYLTVLGLELIIDEAEGYAFLRSRPDDEESEIPRLVSRRPLSYGVSLMLALLRRKLVEFDASGGGTRLILHREDILEMMSVFSASSTNEVRARDKITQDLEKVVKLGFCRKLRGQDDQYEVSRVIKAFVDAQWLSQLQQRMAAARGNEP